jgi:hypothetical protein
MVDTLMEAPPTVPAKSPAPAQVAIELDVQPTGIVATLALVPEGGMPAWSAAVGARGDGLRTAAQQRLAAECERLPEAAECARLATVEAALAERLDTARKQVRELRTCLDAATRAGLVRDRPVV